MSAGQPAERDVLTLHFLPEGREYRFADKKPKVGDQMKRNGDTWVVVDVREDKDGNSVVTLRPVDGTAQRFLPSSVGMDVAPTIDVSRLGGFLRRTRLLPSRLQPASTPNRPLEKRDPDRV